MVGSCELIPVNVVPKAHDLESCLEWENINAFTARLTEAGILKGAQFGFWTLRDALEWHDPWHHPEATLVLCHIRAATMWIEYARHALYEIIHPGYIPGAVPHGTYPSPGELGRGPLYHGPLAFSEERWQFWVDRFSTLAESDAGLGDGEAIMTRVLAARASGLMTEMSVAREKAMYGPVAAPPQVIGESHTVPGVVDIVIEDGPNSLVIPPD